jgi:aspartate/methionine/tyrosine aminotransferase
MPMSDRVSYLRWAKQKTEELRGNADVINLAGSAMELPAATEWFEEELRIRGDELVDAWKQASNEFGLARLKDQIRATFQVPVSHEIVLTGGASGAIRIVYAMLLAGRPKQRWLVEQPYYEPLASVAQRLGAQVEFAPRGAGCDFVDEAARRVTPETSAVVVTNPHNPTGDWLDHGALQRLVDVVAARAPQACVIVDETFGDLSPAVGRSAGNVDERIVTISGLTKCYGLGALRCGWATADRRWFPQLEDDWILFEDIGCKLTEVLGARALEHVEQWRPMVNARLAANRQTMAKWLGELSGEGLLASDGMGRSCVTFPKWLGRTPTFELVERLLQEQRVLVTPGEFFRPVEGMAMRIGFGGNGAKLQEGLRRLSVGLRAIG